MPAFRVRFLAGHARLLPFVLALSLASPVDGATVSFAGWDPHANKDDPKRNPVYFYMGQFMKWLLVGVFSFFGIHTALWLYRSLRAMKGESR